MIRFYLIIILLVACKKEENNLGEEFQRVVGKWENIEGDDRIHITIEASGKIKIEKSTERGQKFKVNYLYKNPNDLIIGGTIWNYYSCYKTYNGETSSVGISYRINSTNDTTRINLGTHVVDFEAQGFGTYFKRIP